MSNKKTSKTSDILCDIYTPQTQKALFNQNCISEIKKFIKDNLNNTKKEYKQILFLNGPSGCGKTATINVLFKNYNIINIDSDNIRVIDNISDIVAGIPAFDSQNLLFLEKKPSKSHLGNLLLIKNAQHCEKSLSTFLEHLYVKCKRNIPIIISNDKQSSKSPSN
jgi:predicted AAA+ superfamily ATPase